jgi:hypothetical protein
MVITGKQAQSLRRALRGMPSCMGGWCTKRDSCALHVQQPRSEHVERVCPSGVDDPVPLLLEADVQREEHDASDCEARETSRDAA